jgi:hypothetical protein
VRFNRINLEKNKFVEVGGSLGYQQVTPRPSEPAGTFDGMDGLPDSPVIEPGEKSNSLARRRKLVPPASLPSGLRNLSEE